MKIVIAFLFSFPFIALAQSSYKDSLNAFIKNYVQTHGVIKGDGRNDLHFYTVDPDYRVVADFEKLENTQWFLMPTSGTQRQIFRIYGIASFKIKNVPLQLFLYKSQNVYQDSSMTNYLFLPFTDITTGKETYEGGRYIDIYLQDIKDNKLIIDFNKAYNPYCAYVSGKYNCPIPPKENALEIEIIAGEKKFKKH